MRFLNASAFALSSSLTGKSNRHSSWISFRSPSEPLIRSGWAILTESFLFIYASRTDNQPQDAILLNGLFIVQDTELDDSWIKLQTCFPLNSWFFYLQGDRPQDTKEFRQELRQLLPVLTTPPSEISDQSAVLNACRESYASQAEIDSKTENSTLDSVEPSGLCYMDDSPLFRRTLDHLFHASDHIKSRWKKIHEACLVYIRAKEQLTDAEHGVMNAILKTSDNDCGLNDVLQFYANYFTQCRKDQEINTVKFKQLFLTSIKTYLDTDIKEARHSKQRSDKALEKYKSALAMYLQMSKETMSTKLHDAEDELKQLKQEYESIRINAYLELGTLVQRDNTTLLLALANWICEKQALNESGIRQFNSVESIAADMRAHVLSLENSLARQRLAVEIHSVKHIKAIVEDTPMLHDVKNPQQWMAHEGYLIKRSSSMRKVWKQRWFTMTNGTDVGKLWYRGNRVDSGKQFRCIDLKLVTVRIPTNVEKRFCFEIVSMSSMRSYFLQAANQSDMDEWIRVIQHNIGVCLSTDSNPQQQQLPANVAEVEGNTICADCGQEEPDWVSLNLAVLVCIDCAGIHRSLGAHISKMRSLSLDALDANSLDVFLKIGNAAANTIWESLSRHGEKPTPTSSREEKETWIRRKYETREFVQFNLPYERKYLAYQALYLVACGKAQDPIAAKLQKNTTACQILSLNGASFEEPQMKSDESIGNQQEEADEDNNVEYVTVRYHFKGTHTGDIHRLEPGDQIRVRSKDDSGWWLGEVNNEIGHFPANYTNAL